MRNVQAGRPVPIAPLPQGVRAGEEGRGLGGGHREQVVGAGRGAAADRDPADVKSRALGELSKLHVGGEIVICRDERALVDAYSEAWFLDRLLSARRRRGRGIARFRPRLFLG